MLNAQYHLLEIQRKKQPYNGDLQQPIFPR
ncbi:hypothetical protein FAM3228_02476 [Lacticaseibacillus paracasei]|nr:hypothetical protein FAM19353_02429 [Lacticaseibacillus paracasei]RNE14721.1 hypothetical protein FAM3228_02476 [Lacticaseibacillus paracasei]